MAFLLADATDTYPEVPAALLKQTHGLMLAFAVLMLVLVLLRWRTVWHVLTAREDPRTFAVLRIGFGLMTMLLFINMAPHWRFLWSDEGLYTLAEAQDSIGNTALRGFSPATGFFDAAALWHFITSKPSAFVLNTSPAFVTAYLWVFLLMMFAYTVGLWSRVTGVVGWVMMLAIYQHHGLFMEGTDVVYRCFWFLLLFARTGHAYSLDNLWRLRRAHKRGDGAITVRYRKVPSWPRYLFMFQLAAIYMTTGAVKTGGIWARGDALYFALSMDHFYRFEGFTQLVGWLFGMNLFRVMTWVTHYWERLFPFVLLGFALQAARSFRDAPWYPRQDSLSSRWVFRAVLLAAYVVLYVLIVQATPYGLAMHGSRTQNPAFALLKVHVVMGGVLPVLAAAWFALRRWPIRVVKSPHTLPRPFTFLTMPAWTLSHVQLERWLLGRRLWLGLGACFHGFLILFMNIGMFPFIMLMTYPAFFSGDDTVAVLRWLARLLPARMRGRLAFAWAPPCEPTATEAPRWRRVAAGLGWGCAVGLMLWHAAAITAHLAPDYNVLSVWRTPLRRETSRWLRITSTTQSWSMFAPNPPQSNTSLQTLVVTQDDQTYDLGDNFIDRPSVWIVNDRMWKMHRRIAGKGKQYRKPWAMYQCRQWALDHDGQTPKEVVLQKIVTRIPPPTLVTPFQPAQFKGRIDPRTNAVSGKPYDPRTLKVATHELGRYPCTGTGELPLYMKERHGLPITTQEREQDEQAQARRAEKHNRRRESWERSHGHR